MENSINYKSLPNTTAFSNLDNFAIFNGLVPVESHFTLNCAIKYRDKLQGWNPKENYRILLIDKDRGVRDSYPLLEWNTYLQKVD